MNHWKNARNWRKVSIRNSRKGFEILLDDKRLLTPKNEAIILKSEKLALKVSREWEQQEKFVKPSTMPITRLVNSAIDQVKVNHQSVVDDLIAYGETDLICYRVTEPADLVQLQEENWDPVLHWARKDLGIDLKCVYGLRYVPQSIEALKEIQIQLNEPDCFALTGISELVNISGSLLLALAVYHNFLKPDEAWRKSVLDEVWHCSKWGHDEESRNARQRKLEDFKFAYQFLSLLN